MKYDYIGNFERIRELVKERWSIRAIARKFKWCPISTQSWINRNCYFDLKLKDKKDK